MTGSGSFNAANPQSHMIDAGLRAAKLLEVDVAALARPLHFDLKYLPLERGERGQPAVPESKPVIRSVLSRDSRGPVRPGLIIRAGFTTNGCCVEGSDSADQFGNISPIPTCDRRRGRR